jgi:ABC-type sugar transport system ATPase subunit
MRELSRQSVAIVMYSTDILEIIGMSDRVIVMYEGKISGELIGEMINEENIMRLAMGIGNESVNSGA